MTRYYRECTTGPALEEVLVVITRTAKNGIRVHETRRPGDPMEDKTFHDLPNENDALDQYLAERHAALTAQGWKLRT